MIVKCLKFAAVLIKINDISYTTVQNIFHTMKSKNAIEEKTVE